MKFSAAIFLSYLTAASAQLDCGPDGTLNIAGSSTVEPIAAAWATGYMAKCPGVKVVVEGGGSSIGAGRVCGRATSGTPVEIGNMSREWRTSEVNVTDKALEKYKCIIGDPTRTVTQMDVALDGITVVVNQGGLAGRCIRKLEGAGLNIDQLRWIYSNFTTDQLKTSGWDSTVIPFDDNNETSHNWNEISTDCPFGEIKLSAPGSLSGTHDFFKEFVFNNYTTNEGFATKRPFGIVFSEDDDVLVNFVATSSAQVFGDAVSFFGFSYFINEGQLLYGIPIKAKGGSAHVAPTIAHLIDGTYNPLGRRIYMNLLDTAVASTGPFLSYGLNQEGISLVKGAGFAEIPKDERAGILARINRAAPEPDVPTPAPQLPPSIKPPAAAPTGVPVPFGTPVAPIVPTAPAPTPTKDTSCGLLGLSIFCPFTFCGIFGRLLGLCSSD